MQARQLDDEGYVGVVVIVGAARHFDDDIGHVDVLGVGAAGPRASGDGVWPPAMLL